MSVSVSTARKLRVIQRQILDRPARFNMESWAERGDCGTTCCIGGYAAANAGVKLRKLADDDALTVNDVPRTLQSVARTNLFSGVPYFDIRDLASKALGITDDQASDLFFDDSWPEQFSNAFRNAQNDKVRAFIAAARIEHFIQTGA